MEPFIKKIGRGFYSFNFDEKSRNIDVTAELTRLYEIFEQLKKVKPVTDSLTGQLKLIY